MFVHGCVRAHAYAHGCIYASYGWMHACEFALVDSQVWVPWIWAP